MKLVKNKINIFYKKIKLIKNRMMLKNNSF